MSAPSTERGTRRWWRSRWLQALVSLLVVALIFGFLFPKVADYGEVWETVTAMTWLELLSLLLIALWNIASYWPLLTAVQEDLRLREAAVVNLASTAISNTLPGGAAIGIGVTLTMQRSWGIPVAATGLATVISGVWNNFVKLGLPVVALALLAVNGEAGAGLTGAAVVGVTVLVAAVVLFVLLLRSETLARRIGHAGERVVSALLAPLRRGPVGGWGDRAARFRASVVDLVDRRWVRITIAAVVSHVSLYLVLLVALRHVGVSDDEISWQKVLAAFAFVRLLSAVPLTPGGLGVVELGLTAALGSGLDDATKNQVAAAVLVYRALTWLLPVPLGIGCWVFWRTNTSWQRTVEERRGDHAIATVGRPGTS